MAHLNVREKLIETKIAYVGAELAGKATNFDHIVADTREGRASPIARTPLGAGALLSLDWRPSGAARFDDCDVVVKLQATHGDVHDDEIDKILADVDGVVLVVDADPAAHDRNRRSLARLRDALERDTDKPVPVVVQVNKADLPDAVPTAELLEKLDVRHWPAVSATATRGDGVVETLQRALDDVLEAMKRARPMTSSVPERPEPSAASRAEGNPLLAALRQILKDTVTERVDALEQRLLERLDEQLGRIDARIGQIEVRLDRDMSRLRADVAGIASELADAEARASVEVRDVARAATQAAITEVSRAATQAIASKLEGHDDKLALLEGTIDATLARAHHAWVQELGTALDTRGRADREHVTSTVSALRRGLDGLGTELRKVGSGAGAPQLADAIAKLDVKLETRCEMLATLIEPTVPVMSGLPKHLGEMQANLQREIKEAVGRKVDNVGSTLDALRTHAAHTAEAVARAEVASGEAREAALSIIEELKKPKKGWFS